MPLEITPLAPAVDAQGDVVADPVVNAVQQLRVAAQAVDVPDFPEPCPYEFRGRLSYPLADRRTERYVAWRDGSVAGYLTLELSQRENLQNAEVTLTVHPQARRRGVGRALYDHVVQRLRHHDRRWWYSTTTAALPDGPPRPADGTAFGARVGAEEALVEVRSRLALASVDEDALAELARDARAHSAGYETVSWQLRTPQAHLDDASRLDARLVADAPTGDLAIEPPNTDPARLRDQERGLEACRWRLYHTGAVHADTGQLVAVTALARQHSSPWHAFQWVTVVDPSHRGHRLGTLVKLENLRHLRAHEPQVAVIDTWNAAENRHMRAINDAMGFSPVDRWIDLQQELSSGGTHGW